MKNVFSFTRIVGFVLVSGALLSGCSTNPNKPSEELIQRVASAKTAADHESLATYYEGEAAKSRKSAAQYRRSADQWRTDPRQRVTNAARYDSLIKSIDAEAEEFDKLAAQQRSKACSLSPSDACKPVPVKSKN